MTTAVNDVFEIVTLYQIYVEIVNSLPRISTKTKERISCSTKKQLEDEFTQNRK